MDRREFFCWLRGGLAVAAATSLIVRDGTARAGGPLQFDPREAGNMSEPKADDRPSCLVLHGLGGGPYEMAPLTEALEAEGIRVLAPILPGHEGPGRVMPASDWRDWASASESAFDQLAAEGRPVVVLGFSTGGTLALRLATRRPVARLVLLAPFLAIRFSGLVPIRPASYLRRIARIIPDIPRRPPAVRDREVRRRVAGLAQFQTFSLRSTLSALELIEEVRRLVPEITTPTLILQGKRDTVVEPADALWLYRKIGANPKALVVLPRSDHLIAYDRESDRAIAEALDFALGRGVRFEGRELP
ncbi:alpha/beta hydrolase [Tundrisphaera lichenicola]|uniref:alpha/beta hydrolase n=1 Tax=Tundrisphaera lichenicola TaxID=2029860 RepID=UPI003EBE704C